MEGACPVASSESCMGSGVTGANALFFTSLIASLLKSERELGNPEHYPADASQYLLDEYDFIIVGGGTAGSVVAGRLSEVSNWNVLVIEAGNNPPLHSDIPALFFTMLNTDVDWKYKSTPEDGYCQGLKNKRCNYPRGKMLGGSGSINGMLYFKGVRGDFDNWAENGNNGWSDDEVIEYFKKYEDFKWKDPKKKSNLSYYGTGGPIGIEKFQTFDIAWSIMEAVKEAGHKKLKDINGPTQHGFAHLRGTIRNGTRCSSAKAFLGQGKDRKNLHVIKDSQVTKIVIDPSTMTVKGVEFTSKDGKTRFVGTRKEVIISAGVINTPQILMLSGIGPESHLKEIGIEPVKNLRVGENFQDHLIYLGSLFTTKKLKDAEASVSAFNDASYKYLRHRTGLLSSHYGTTVSGFVKTGRDKRPDIELLFFVILANDTNAAEGVSLAFGFEDDTTDSLKEMAKEGNVIMAVTLLSRPRSRGEILLSSSNPLDAPKIYPGFLTDSNDLETILAGIKATDKIMETNAMKKLDAKKKKLFVKQCSGLEFDSRPYLECMLRHIGTSSFHPVGTCKMGPSTDPSAVVDPELKVHAVKGIRVADASIMPFIVSSPTQATTLMIGERAADFIKKEWLK